VRLTIERGQDSAWLTRTLSLRAELDVDANRNGVVADDPLEDQWNQTHGAVFYFNLDDDNGNSNEDHKDAVKAPEDVIDLARMRVRNTYLVPSVTTATIKLNTEAQGNVRVYQLKAGAWSVLYTGGADFTIPIADLQAADVMLGVEGRSRLSPMWDGYVDFTLEIRDAAAALHSSDVVRMRQAPPLFATNLWEPTELHVVSDPTGTANNTAFITSLTAVTGAAGITLRVAPGATYNYDRWIQDSSEPAVVLLPDAGGKRVVDEVFQCYRLRPIDAWCRANLLGPDFGFQERFGALNTSLNYGGNIEVVPPHNGRAWGRVMIGGGNGPFVGTSTPATEYMDNANRQYFDANALQGTHVQVTTEWLAVGHVDEYTMFIPAPNTARGYVCLIASPMRAWNQLVALNGTGGGALQVFPGRTTYSWQTTVGAIVGDAALGTLQGQVQTRIDQGRSEIKAATGLTDADFIELPVLFEHVGGGWLAAYNPGVVNLVCLPAANGTTYLVIPDPEGPNPGTGDIWKLDIQAQLAPLQTAGNPYDITFTDVFYSYHDLLGEAHCGTNTVRTPPNEDWWDK
jgi:protein-arginine deiminase